MKVEYDADADAMYITLRKGQYKVSQEISENVIIDLDKNCRILGIEILGISAKIESAFFRQLLRAEKIALKVRT